MVSRKQVEGDVECGEDLACDDIFARVTLIGDIARHHNGIGHGIERLQSLNGALCQHVGLADPVARHTAWLQVQVSDLCDKRHGRL